MWRYATAIGLVLVAGLWIACQGELDCTQPEYACADGFECTERDGQLGCFPMATAEGCPEPDSGDDGGGADRAEAMRDQATSLMEALVPTAERVARLREVLSDAPAGFDWERHEALVSAIRAPVEPFELTVADLDQARLLFGERLGLLEYIVALERLALALQEHIALTAAEARFLEAGEEGIPQLALLFDSEDLWSVRARHRFLPPDDTYRPPSGRLVFADSLTFRTDDYSGQPEFRVRNLWRSEEWVPIYDVILTDPSEVATVLGDEGALNRYQARIYGLRDQVERLAAEQERLLERVDRRCGGCRESIAEALAERSAQEPAGPAEPTTSGGLSGQVITQVARAHQSRLRQCYQRGLRSNPDLAGRVVISFVINPFGEVQEADIRRSDLHDGGVESCLLDVIMGWRFPFPDPAGEVYVNYPIDFTPG
jgi:TonB family protein